MIDLRRLSYFIRAAELGSLRQAAEEMGVAQPVMTRQIQILERELGVELLIRERQRIRPTEAGRALLDRGRLLLAEAGDIRLAMRQRAQPAQRRLVLGTMLSFLDDLLPRALSLWRQEHAGYSVSIRGTTTADILAFLREGTIDLGFVVAPIEPEGIERRVLGQEPYVGVCAPQDPLMAEEDGGVEELLAGPLITMPPGLLIRTAADEIAAALGRHINPAVEVQSMDAIKALVRSGFGRSIMPISAIGRDLRQGNISVLGIPRRLAPLRTVLAIYRTSDPPKPAVRALIEAFVRIGRESGVLQLR